MAPVETVLAAIDKNLEAALGRLFKLIAIPSISTDPAFVSECARAAEWLAGDLRSMGFEASVRKTAGHPMVTGKARAQRPDVPHLLFYGHYDVQPPDPLGYWKTPPFEPQLAEAGTGKQITGRGAADDKGQLMTFIEACRAFQETGGLPCHITFLIEGEEETGSPSLPAFLADAKAELSADMALVCDTNMWDRETPAITAMLRGLVLEEVVIHGPGRDLHSGYFGGAAVNPIHVLARIIADLRDGKGRITLPGFYDGVAELPEEIAAQWRELPFSESGFLGEAG
ncbi:MAG TPA: M20/M25/M40 family metallo-hydrolase, partial [Methylocella sp.]|nr:M20/M25/M40 family metallo-hydrolase [Methylocella sp.]